MKNVVDEFVLVESEITFSGKQKPLYFELNKQKFSEFNIKHVIIPNNLMLQFEDNWDREYLQRNYIQEVLKDYPNDTITMISDLDEIPRAESVMFVCQNLQRNKIIKLKQNHYYYLNGLVISEEDWKGTTICYKSLLNEFTPHQIRTNDDRTEYVSNAGWHFSYVGGIDRIKQKIQAYSHQEYNNELFTDVRNLKRSLETGSNLFSGNKNYVKYVDIDNTYPKYLLDNLDKFRHLIFYPDKSEVKDTVTFRVKVFGGYEVEVRGNPDEFMQGLEEAKRLSKSLPYNDLILRHRKQDCIDLFYFDNAYDLDGNLKTE